MSPVAWVGEREHTMPPALAAHLREAMAGAERGEVTGTPDRLIAAGIDLVATVAAAEPMSRDQALDLLVADALLTYAFEAAADEPETLVARADAAMRRIAKIGR